MKLYRFSPILDKATLLQAIEHIHFEGYKMCKKSFGEYLPNAGNMGIFTRYENEFKLLKSIRDELCEPTDNLDLKYYTLRDPIKVQQRGEVPGATYTHLYIRRMDPYRHHVGDVDFYLEDEAYAESKLQIAEGDGIPGSRVFSRPDLDMIELYDPDVDVLGYVSTSVMTEKVRIKLSEATKL